MAGKLPASLCGRVSVIAIILLECFLLVLATARQVPCGSHFPDQNWQQYRAEGDVMLFLRERCETNFDIMEIERFLLSQHSNSGLLIDIMPATSMCDAKTRGLEAFVHLIGQRRVKAVIATLDAESCEIAGKFAHLWDVPLLTWTCPLKDPREQIESSMIRLSPSVPSLANALVQLFLYLGWKTAVLISIDSEPWTSLERAVTTAFHASGIVVRQKIVLAQHSTPRRIRETLKPIRKLSRKATVLCLPATTEQSTTTVLMELDITIRSNKHRFAIILLHTQEDDLFLPNNRQPDVNSREDESQTETLPETAFRFQPADNRTTDAVLNILAAGITDSFDSAATASDNLHAENTSFDPSLQNQTQTIESQSEATLAPNTEETLSQPEANSTVIPFDEYVDPLQIVTLPLEATNARISYKFIPPGNLSKATMRSLHVFAPLDQRYDIEQIYKGSVYYEKANLLDHLNESLFLLRGLDTHLDASNNKMYNYALINWQNANWNPILVAVQANQAFSIQRLTSDLLAIDNIGPLGDAECDDLALRTDDFNSLQVECLTENPTDIRRSQFPVAHIVSVSLGSLLVTLVAIATAILIRGQLLRRRMSKGPYKIILTTSDFVFPQVAQVDSRGVDEGIETMLCCWLQQLQEFGGPEVEKPDLLQLGSIGSLRPYLQNSTGNLARNTFLKDPRARYNGDLVQLKELPCQGTFELKAKAMTTLVTIHGLRHENLNPLIGCLNEPTRPCLVYDYCSRGSLEDVLVQDEIKLDWSFRLSLLTDLVRGMRYLHGTPIRVHGSLTSRNCVIDARWVLKLTDYGLPAFYEAQDLLWTAPELLREPSLRKKGTQPGDVYSFGIIMQEVVVRGEPFCMLALSPDEIIEKVKKPPPLIRPSVSKGAAPPEAINIMRQCWAEAPDMRPDFNNVHDLFKKLNHGRKVNFMDTMFQMLEKYSNNLEELIRERTEQLDMEKKKTEQLLNRMLPSSVADKLKLGMPVDPEEFREVTIYFSDIVGFTTISAHSTPFQVVDLLNDLYTCFDATINAYTVYKVETIGDAYMVVAGCPVRIPDHATQIATMALDLLHQSGKFRLRHLPKTQLKLRIGLHTGPCCAGVVGLTMPRYCLFGDTVNTASRMESTGAAWRIHMSQATRDRLVEAGGYQIEYRGKTDVKGKGQMPTYWLLGKQGFDKDLPIPPPLGEDQGLTEEEALAGTLEEEQSARLKESSLLKEKAVLGSDQQSEQRHAAGSHTREITGTAENPFNSTVVEIEESSVPVESDRTVARISIALEKNTNAPTRGQAGLRAEKKLLQGNGEHIGPTSVGAGIASKGTLADPRVSLGSCSILDTTASMLAASTTSLTSISSAAASGAPTLAPSYKAATTSSRQRKIPPYAGIRDENDLSTPYNYYRCLSPNEHSAGKVTGSRLLKRQFSLDRPDEPVAAACVPSSNADQHQSQRHYPFQSQQQQRITVPRLYKQNSAGAANDLERIDEIPSSPRPTLRNYRHAASVSLSVESLSFH